MEHFNELLGEYVQAVFVLDMAGFSSTVKKHGVIHCLSMVQRMHALVEPTIDLRHSDSTSLHRESMSRFLQYGPRFHFQWWWYAPTPES